MKKVVSLLGAALCLALVVPAYAQAPDMFKDLPTDHWAYQATEALRAKGILWGYPDGYFRGKRTLTRYEFAVALDRLLQQVDKPGTPGPKGDTGATGEKGEKGDQGVQGEKGDKGDPGMTPEEIAKVTKLVDEFGAELKAMGKDVQAISRKLDALTKDVAAVKKAIDAMPKISGNLFFGFRSDRAKGPYVDADGRLHTAGTYSPGELSRLVGSTDRDLVNSAAVVHQFNLGIDAKVPGGGNISAILTTDNYKSYLGGDLGLIGDRVTNPASSTYIKKLEFTGAIGGPGRDSKLTVGRFGLAIGPYTLAKVQPDSYFANPFDTDKYYGDGVKVDTKFGSVDTSIYAANFSGVQDTLGNAINTPATSPYANEYPLRLNQIAGVSLGLNLKEGLGVKGGALKFNALAGTGEAVESSATSLVVLSSELGLTFSDSLSFKGDWSKSNVGLARFKGNRADDNGAFAGVIDYTSGKLAASAGYKYIQSGFCAPGSWGKIGNVYNPVNIKGPVLDVAYQFAPNFGFSVGGAIWNQVDKTTESTEALQTKAGLKWDMSKALYTTLDWEGLYGKVWSDGVKVFPTEHYITLGAGYKLTSATAVKMAYQIGSYDGHGVMSQYGINRYNFNAFTTSVAVKF